MAQGQSGVSGEAGGGALTGMAALFVAAALLGFAPILVKASELGPHAIAFWRLALALPVLLVWLVIDRSRSRARRAQPVTRPPGMKMLLLAGVFFAGDLAFWHTGIKITTAANATLLANLTPIPVTIAALVLFGERINARFVLAGGLALAGAGLLSAANFQLAPERLPGDVLSALTACWYAAYFLAVRAARRAGAATVQVMFWSTLVASPIALLVVTGFGEPLLPDTAAGWWPLLGLGVVAHVAGQGGVAFGLGRTPAALASLIILVQPVVAAGAGWWFFDEALGPLQWAGAGLVLLGVYAAQRVRPGVRPLSTPAAPPGKS
ncbi:MAG: DMT family transporter [Oceanicaulis sp.]